MIFPHRVLSYPLAFRGINLATNVAGPDAGQGQAAVPTRFVRFTFIVTGLIFPHRVLLSYWTEEAVRRYG